MQALQKGCKTAMAVKEPTPQFQMGATSDEAELYAEITANKIPGPGAIANQLRDEDPRWAGRQFRLPRHDNPRAEPDAQIGRDGGGGPYG